MSFQLLCCETLHFPPCCAIYLFTLGWGKIGGRYDLARLQFSLSSSTAPQQAQEDLFMRNGQQKDSCLRAHYSAFTLWLMLAVVISPRTTEVFISKTIGLAVFLLTSIHQSAINLIKVSFHSKTPQTEEWRSCKGVLIPNWMCSR